MSGKAPVALVLSLAFAATPAAAQSVKEASLFAGIAGSGARALGMGGAFIAVADDATASSWNPAGLCVLEKPEAAAAGQPFAMYKTQFGETSFVNDFRSTSGTSSTTQRTTQVSQPYDYTPKSRTFDFASFTYPLRAGSVKLVPQISYQRVIDLGPDVDYGVATATSTSVTQTFGTSTSNGTSTSSGQSIVSGDSKGGVDLIAASLGLSFTQKLYLGVAVNFWRNGEESSGTTTSTTNTLGQGILGSSTSSVSAARSLKETFKGTNFHAGLIFKPSSKLSLGAVYKQPFDMEYTYRFTSETTSNSVSTSGTTTTRSTNVTTSTVNRTGPIRWPRTIGGGVAVKPTDLLTFSFDYTRIQWSKAELLYSQDQTTASTRTITTSTPGQPDRVTPQPPSASNFSSGGDVLWPRYFVIGSPVDSFNDPQNDARQIRFGAEYVIRQPGMLGLLVLPVRVGFVRDGQIFTRTSILETVNYNGVTVGVGLVWSKVSLDVAYLYARGDYDDDYTTSSSSFAREAKVSTQRLVASTVFRF